jgi:MoaA/NifB/PqqE/SkfB family radical SAM enzyme
MTLLDEPKAAVPVASFRRLWVYTNYDCNLSCKYCLSSSSPNAPRREIPFDAYKKLIEEAALEGMDSVFLTGGEPFLLPDIVSRIEHALDYASVTVLTNGLLLRGERLARLRALRTRELTLQISLDGHLPELHDAYRGAGTWKRTVQSIRRVIQEGFRVAIGATATPLNGAYEDQLRAFALGLGIPEDRFFMRPLTRTGFSDEGVELQPEAVVPEVTITLDGVFWHPQSGGSAHLLSRTFSPLRPALDLLNATYERILAGGPRPQVYRCA